MLTAILLKRGALAEAGSRFGRQWNEK